MKRVSPVKAEEIFDRLSLIFVLVLFIFSIFLTSIFKYVLFFFLPILFLLKKVFSKQEFLKQVFYQRSPLLSIVVYLLFLIPIISAFIHHEDIGSDPFRSQWLNHDNSWIVLYCYCLANYFLILGEKYGQLYNFLARLALMFSFFVDFLYAFYKWFLIDFAPMRWQGSSGNPQLWGAQASLILIIWLVSYKEIENFTRHKKLGYIFLFSIIFAIFASGSVSNFIGLSFASLAWLGLPFFFSISLAIAFLASSYLGIHNFLEDKIIEIESMKDDLGLLAKKFLPRLRIWSRLEHIFPYESFNPFVGMGFTNYKNLVNTITNNNNFHVHSVFFHNYFLSGVFGVIINFAFAIFCLSKDLLENKYIQAILLFIVANSAFECASIYIELQAPFWLFMPLLMDVIVTREVVATQEVVDL